MTPLSGCLVPLLSIVLRGALPRILFRSVARSRLTAYTVLARGVGTATQIGRVAAIAPGQTQILASSGRILGQTQQTARSVRVLSNGRLITRSDKRGDGILLHRDSNGAAFGSSRNAGEFRVNHHDARGRLSSYDVVNKRLNRVDHYTVQNKRIGSTRLDLDGGQMQLEADSPFEDFLESALQPPPELCASAEQERREFSRIKAMCSVNGLECENQRSAMLRFRQAVKNCG